MKYKKKPAVVDAWRNIAGEVKPEWLRKSSFASFFDGNIYVDVPKGTVVCRPGYWVVREDNGELTVHEPEEFAKTHEAVVEGADGRTYAIPGETDLVEAMLRLSDEAAKANTEGMEKSRQHGYAQAVHEIETYLRRQGRTLAADLVHRNFKP